MSQTAPPPINAERRFGSEDALLAGGLAFILLGVGVWSLPAACILFGLILLVAAVGILAVKHANEKTKGEQ